MNKQTFFAQLWHAYIRITPQAEQIERLFTRNAARIVNDHIAFRTFDLAPINIASLEPHILALGYQPLDTYQFAEKHLVARSYLGLQANDPKIFLSELTTTALTANSQQFVHDCCAHIQPEHCRDASILCAERLWDMPSWRQYQALLQESAYAAWLSVMGLRANHFTIAVHALSPPCTLQQVNAKIKAAGFVLNTQGGEIKGTPDDLLEQSATVADQLSVPFADGDMHTIPTCYYEFARRHPDPHGRLFQGFLAANADKIFTSTDTIGAVAHA